MPASAKGGASAAALVARLARNAGGFLRDAATLPFERRVPRDWIALHLERGLLEEPSTLPAFLRRERAPLPLLEVDEGLTRAAGDPRVRGVVVRLGRPLGFARAASLARAFARVRAAGKRVVVWAASTGNAGAWLGELGGSLLARARGPARSGRAARRERVPAPRARPPAREARTCSRPVAYKTAGEMLARDAMSARRARAARGGRRRSLRRPWSPASPPAGRLRGARARWIDAGPYLAADAEARARRRPRLRRRAAREARGARLRAGRRRPRTRAPREARPIPRAYVRVARPRFVWEPLPHRPRGGGGRAVLGPIRTGAGDRERHRRPAARARRADERARRGAAHRQSRRRRARVGSAVARRSRARGEKPVIALDGRRRCVGRLLPGDGRRRDLRRCRVRSPARSASSVAGSSSTACSTARDLARRRASAERTRACRRRCAASHPEERAALRDDRSNGSTRASSRGSPRAASSPTPVEARRRGASGAAPRALARARRRARRAARRVARGAPPRPACAKAPRATRPWPRVRERLLASRSVGRELRILGVEPYARVRPSTAQTPGPPPRRSRARPRKGSSRRPLAAPQRRPRLRPRGAAARSRGADPGAVLLGVEVSLKRVLKARRLAVARSSQRVRVRLRPRRRRRVLPPGCVERVLDQLSRSLAEEAPLSAAARAAAAGRLLARALAPGALLHVATDHEGYRDWIADVMAGRGAFLNLHAPEPFVGVRPERRETAYEAEWREEGRTMAYFDYRRAP